MVGAAATRRCRRPRAGGHQSWLDNIWLVRRDRSGGFWLIECDGSEPISMDGAVFIYHFPFLVIFLFFSGGNEFLSTFFCFRFTLSSAGRTERESGRKKGGRGGPGGLEEGMGGRGGWGLKVFTDWIFVFIWKRKGKKCMRPFWEMFQIFPVIYCG